jgi:Zn-dependent metalloprotease
MLFSRARAPARRTAVLLLPLGLLGCQPGPALDRFGAPADAVSAAQDHVRARGPQVGIERPDQVRATGVFRDERGDVHVRMWQTVTGVPVWGGDFVVHVGGDGTVAGLLAPHVPDTGLVDGELVAPGPARPGGNDFTVDTAPALDAEAAIGRALSAHGCADCLTAPPRADLWVLRHGGANRLAWRVSLRREDGSAHTALPVFFVDAHDGAILSSYDNLQTVDGRGQSLYSGAVMVQTSSDDEETTFFLEDLDRRSGTFDFRGSTSESAVRPLSDTDNDWKSASQQAAVDAHFGAARTLDYYQTRHQRDGIDGDGGPGFYQATVDDEVRLISSRVHYGDGYQNAFWNGQNMTYGDGDGVELLPLVTLDITGHEMTHGVTERSANLTFSGQPGALNESWSDVFGAMVQRSVRGPGPTVWLVGEECLTPEVGGDAVRSLSNPHEVIDGGFTGDDDPDHYSERYTGLLDNGGVHINSGVANKAFYLLSEGGSHHRGGSMTGIGAEDAARIWYRALTTKLTSSSNFATARLATLAAAADLFGDESAQVEAVSQTWCLVGVGSCEDHGYVGNGGFEGREAPWQHSGGAAFYSNDGNYPHQGTGYVYIGGMFNTDGVVFQQLTIPADAASAQLSFRLNVTSNESAANPQDVLTVEVADATGKALAAVATFSSRDKGAPGVYREQGGYDLLAHKGAPIQLRFRATKAALRNTTFRIDDVRID